MKENKLIIAVVLFIIIPLLLSGVYSMGIKRGKDIMFYQLKALLEKAGIELIDGKKKSLD